MNNIIINQNNIITAAEDQPDHKKFISLFSSKKLTLWLSTKGAHTPLHYDVYGCNVVMQLKGSKKWQLWQPNRLLSSSTSSSSSPIAQGDPSETSTARSKIFPKLPCLRVPYEESSVYSTYDPRTSSINDVGHIPPSHSFVLEEGDILFIPKHFWHFVETVTDLSLSVNLWLPYPLPQQPSFMPSRTIPEQTDTKKTTGEELNLKVKEASEENKLKSEDLEKAYNKYISSDEHSRLLEAATRFVFGALKGSIQNVFDTDDVTAGWINPSEQEGTLDSTIEPSCGGREDDRDSNEDEDDDYDDNDNNDDDRDEDDDNDDDDDDDDEEREGENMSAAKEINMPEGSKNKAAMRHLAYLASSLFMAQHLFETVEVNYEGNEKTRKECERSRRTKRGGYSNQVIIGIDGKAKESTDEKFGKHSKHFEKFLKRFVNALLEPERIEKCLMESL